MDFCKCLGKNPHNCRLSKSLQDHIDLTRVIGNTEPPVYTPSIKRFVYNEAVWTSDAREKQLFVFHNTSNTVTALDEALFIETLRIKCPRCKQVAEHTIKIPQELPVININDIKGICKHCKLKESSKVCSDCTNALRLFLSTKQLKPGEYVPVIERWLSTTERNLKREGHSGLHTAPDLKLVLEYTPIKKSIISSAPPLKLQEKHIKSAMEIKISKDHKYLDSHTPPSEEILFSSPLAAKTPSTAAHPTIARRRDISKTFDIIDINDVSRETIQSTDFSWEIPASVIAAEKQSKSTEDFKYIFPTKLSVEAKKTQHQISSSKLIHATREFLNKRGEEKRKQEEAKRFEQEEKKRKKIDKKKERMGKATEESEKKIEFEGLDKEKYKDDQRGKSGQGQLDGNKKESRKHEGQKITNTGIKELKGKVTEPSEGIKSRKQEYENEKSKPIETKHVPTTLPPTSLTKIPEKENEALKSRTKEQTTELGVDKEQINIKKSESADKMEKAKSKKNEASVSLLDVSQQKNKPVEQKQKELTPKASEKKKISDLGIDLKQISIKKSDLDQDNKKRKQEYENEKSKPIKTKHVPPTHPPTSHTKIPEKKKEAPKSRTKEQTTELGVDKKQINIKKSESEENKKRKQEYENEKSKPIKTKHVPPTHPPTSLTNIPEKKKEAPKSRTKEQTTELGVDKKQINIKKTKSADKMEKAKKKKKLASVSLLHLSQLLNPTIEQKKIKPMEQKNYESKLKREMAEAAKARLDKKNALEVDRKNVVMKKKSKTGFKIVRVKNKQQRDTRALRKRNLPGRFLKKNLNLESLSDSNIYYSDMKGSNIQSVTEIIVKQKILELDQARRPKPIQGGIEPILFKATDKEVTDLLVEVYHEDPKIEPTKTPKKTPASDDEQVHKGDMKYALSDKTLIDKGWTVLPTQKDIRKSDDEQLHKGVMKYALSDKTFIDKGWTVLPTQKVIRKMNVYRMRPARPEFDWFEHNKNKGLLQYDTGEKLADFTDNGRGRWFYKNGNIALEYYDAEESNAQQRFIVFSSGEPDERGRSRAPMSVLATFDHNGNGIVFDHTGKIRLKYNQTEGVVLDKTVGPVSNWKWHSLNDPPVLQQVMIDTQLPHKDPRIQVLGSKNEKMTLPDNEDMRAIELDNFLKEKGKKTSEVIFKPFQIRMKALKINENFSLRVLDQASVYLHFREGKTNLKLNLGMILDHKEIVDTGMTELGQVTTSVETLPAETDSVVALQNRVAQVQKAERARVGYSRWLRMPVEPASVDRMAVAASRAPRRPLPAAAMAGTCCNISCNVRKPSTTSIYYDNRFI